MSGLETLRMLAAGERPASGLLHTARLSAFGSKFYGAEAIVEALQRDPRPLSDAAQVLAASGHIAIFDGDTAIFADLHREQVGRIWLLGNGQPAARETALSVAFDPDLAQARGDVFAAVSDHPSLEPDAFEQVLSAGRTIANDDPTSYRTRAFCVRAFGSPAQGAALFAVHRLADQPVRTSGFAMAAAHWAPGGLTIIRDRSGEAALTEAAWTPRIGTRPPK
jgi:hypothetical protein